MTESLADTLAGVCFLILMVLIVVWDYQIRQRRKGVKSRAEWEAERACRAELCWNDADLPSCHHSRALRGVPRRG